MALLILVVATGLLLYIAWQDFMTLKIRNPHVIALALLAVAYAAAAGLETLPSDLIAGVVLFVMAFIFWLLGLVGAGDTKLYFPVGVLIGIAGFVPYLILLLAFSIALVLLVRLGPSAPEGRGRIGGRLAELRERRAVPYSLPMVFASLGTLIYLGKFSL